MITFNGREILIKKHQVYYFYGDSGSFYFGSIYKVSKNEVVINLGMGLFRYFKAVDGIIDLPLYDGRPPDGAPVSEIKYK